MDQSAASILKQGAPQTIPDAGRSMDQNIPKRKRLVDILSEEDQTRESQTSRASKSFNAEFQMT